MKSIAWNAARLLGSAFIVTVAGSWIYRLFGVVWVGQFWATAPLPLTFIVAVFCPAAIVAVTMLALNLIWRKS